MTTSEAKESARVVVVFEVGVSPFRVDCGSELFSIECVGESCSPPFETPGVASLCAC